MALLLHSCAAGAFRAAPADAVTVVPGGRCGLVEEDLPEAQPAGNPVAGHTPAPVAAAPAKVPAAAAALDAPSPLNAIGPHTPANVAAATRLADAGRNRLAAGDDAIALEQLERAVAIDPSNAYAYFFLAELHFRHRTFDQAIAFADRAADLSDAGGAPQWTGRAYALQGKAFEAAGRFADARAAYARAVRAAPDNLAAHVGLARLGAPAEAAAP
ncbi:MAG: tetratricopeptide repeat protein [Candidatus Binatia bacterium]